MACFYPLTGYYGHDKGPSGKRRIVFKKDLSFSGIPIRLQCGQCIGCKMEKARQWAVRCLHEKKMHDQSAFVTLTYDEKSIPLGGSLVKRDLQLFMKRLRKHYGRGIRFYACGEYGDTTWRPHYHLLLFNLGFPDARKFSTGKGGHGLYTSETLTKIWGLGHAIFGEVTTQSCGYVARYIFKKMSGPLAENHYQTLTLDGEIIDRQPEFTVMSRRPGIGAAWFDRYHTEVYAWDSIISGGKEMRPPNFYDKRFELLDQIRLEELKRARRRRALIHKADNTSARRRVRELVELRRIAFYQKRTAQ